MTSSLSDFLKTNPTKPWKSQILNGGETFTVTSAMSLVTATACAAGGMGVNPNAASLANPSNQQSFEFVDGVHPTWSQYVGSASYTGTIAVVNRDVTTGRIVYSGNASLYSSTYAVMARVKNSNGLWYNLLANSYSSNQYFYSSSDGFISSLAGSVSASSQPVDLLVDPTGVSPIAVVVGNNPNYCSYVSDYTVAGASFNVLNLSACVANIFGGRALNGNWVVFGTKAVGTNPGFTYGVTTGVSFAAVIVNGSDTCQIQDMAYSASLGLYVAVGTNGKIYTATAIGGTWTSRTSGVATTLSGILWANSRFVVTGAGGVILTSSNGTTWAVATGTGATDFNRRAVAWSPTGAVFGAMNTSGAFYTSPDGATWTAAAGSGPNCWELRWAGGQWWAFAQSATPRYSKNGGATWTALSTIGSSPADPRSDTVILKNGVETIRLRGGQNGNGSIITGTSKGGNGGSYRQLEPAGSLAYQIGGAGPSGNGGAGFVQAITGSYGIVSGLNLATGKNAGNGNYDTGYYASGGGGVPQYADLITSSTIGAFFPGGGGGFGYNSSSNPPYAGAGGSLFALGGNATYGSTQDKARLPGRGSMGCYWNNSSTNQAPQPGGGGESCFRVPIPCTAGDVIEAAPGLSGMFIDPYSSGGNGNQGHWCGNGYIQIEWQE